MDTECIYLYRDGHVTVRGGYRDRVDVNGIPQRLQTGDVSLTLRGLTHADYGLYTCQVISGPHNLEGIVVLGGKSHISIVH